MSIYQKALHDYFYSLSGKRIKKETRRKTEYIIFFFFYFMMIGGLYLDAFENVRTAMEYVGIIGSFSVCAFIEALTKLYLPKQMYICPTTKEERKEYLNTFFWFKILVPILQSSCVYVILGIALKWTIFQVSAYLLCMISFVLCLTMENLKKQEKRLRGIRILETINSLSLVVLCVLTLESKGVISSVFEGIIVGVTTALQMIADVLLLVKYKKELIEQESICTNET